MNLVLSQCPCVVASHPLCPECESRGRCSVTHPRPDLINGSRTAAEQDIVELPPEFVCAEEKKWQLSSEELN